MVRTMTMRSSFDDLDISVVVVSPETEPRAVMQISHGMCGCKERYMPLMEYMAGKGVVCVAGDHRGHGGSIRTTEDLGYMYSGGYKALVSDMRMITDWIHGEYPGKPVYLLGHSMGSMAVRVYVKEDDSSVDGLIVCGSPSWDPMSYLGAFLTGMMCRMGMSRHRMTISQKMTSNRYNRRFSSEGYQAWTCSDPLVRKASEANPLCNFEMTANGSYNIMKLMIATYDNSSWTVSRPQMPIIFLSGEDDPLMISERRFHKAAQNICDRGYVNVTSALYPGMRHEVLNEIGKEELWADILDFMKL